MRRHSDCGVARLLTYNIHRYAAFKQGGYVRVPQGKEAYPRHVLLVALDLIGERDMCVQSQNWGKQHFLRSDPRFIKILTRP